MLNGSWRYKIEKKLGTEFDRTDSNHVWTLAEFFGLTPAKVLDPYSTPMEEGDVNYFANVEANQDTELFP